MEVLVEQLGRVFIEACRLIQAQLANLIELDAPYTLLRVKNRINAQEHDTDLKSTKNVCPGICKRAPRQSVIRLLRRQRTEEPFAFHSDSLQAF